MKSPLLFLFLTIASFISAQKIDPDGILGQQYTRTFDFIFKLDSLGLTHGGLNYLEESTHNKMKVKEKKVNAAFSKQNDSIYRVIIRRQKFSLNTKSGWIIDLQSGKSVYRNHKFRIAESNKSNIHGTDSLGNWTAYLGGFMKTPIGSNIEYEPKWVEPNKTVQYEVRHTSMTDGDSTWIESDTTRSTVIYGADGRKERETTERYGARYPELVEYVYTYFGDTCIGTLARIERKPAPETNGDGLIFETNQFFKTVSTSTNGKTHDYLYSQRENNWDLHITDTFWTVFPEGRIYVIEEEYANQTVFSEKAKTYRESRYRQTYTYKAK